MKTLREMMDIVKENGSEMEQKEAFTVKELIAELSKVADQDALVYFDEGSVDLPIGRTPKLQQFTNKDGIKVSYVLL
jgi:hypothetical protein